MNRQLYRDKEELKGRATKDRQFKRSAIKLRAEPKPVYIFFAVLYMTLTLSKLQFANWPPSKKFQ